MLRGDCFSTSCSSDTGPRLCKHDYSAQSSRRASDLSLPWSPDSDEAPLSPHAPCALCADDEAIGCVPVPGRSALLCAACADANDRWTTPTESIAAGFQRSSLRPFGMRVLTPLEEQTIAMSRAHMLVLKLSCANAGSGEQPVLRKHVFPHPRKPCLQQSCAKQLRLSE